MFKVNVLLSQSIESVLIKCFGNGACCSWAKQSLRKGAKVTKVNKMKFKGLVSCLIFTSSEHHCPRISSQHYDLECINCRNTGTKPVSKLFFTGWATQTRCIGKQCNVILVLFFLSCKVSQLPTVQWSHVITCSQQVVNLPHNWQY